jgi:hypothetical protein
MQAPFNLRVSSGSVRENSATNTNIGLIEVSDVDAGQTYTCGLDPSIVTSTPAGSFTIVGSNTLVVGTATLNFEATKQYALGVKCSDNGNPVLSVSQSITITVTDVNEAPTSIALSSNSVRELASTGTVVGSMSVADVDAGDTFTFSLIDSAGGRFRISGSRVEVSQGSLVDFETASSHSIVVEVTDSGSLSFQQTLQIVVVDINEAPYNLQLSNRLIAENSASSTVLGTLTASDDDINQSLLFSLLLDGSGRFGLVGGNTVVFVGQPSALDYEQQAEHIIRVRVQDAGGLAGLQPLYQDVQFTVVVTQANDGPFDLTISASTVSENSATGSFIATLTGLDEDSNDKLVFELVDNKDKFQLGNGGVAVCSAGSGASGSRANTVCMIDLLVGGALNYEALVIATWSSALLVQLRVTDGLGGSYVEMVGITVQDVNEEPFDISIANNEVGENAQSGTAISAVSVRDFDFFQAITCISLTSGFAVNNNMLSVGTGISLDYETRSSYNVTLRCTDNGSPPASTSRSVRILVRDLNEAPTDLRLSSNTVDENAATGSVVGTVSAVDVDAGDAHTFKMTNNANGRFQLTNGNQVSVLDGTRLNFETLDSHFITIEAADKQSLSYSKSFTIRLNNVNDRPTNLQLSASRIVETATQNTVIGQLSVSDEDAGQSVTCSVVNAAAQAMFGVGGSSGKDLLFIGTSGSLNYEVTSTYAVIVRCTDTLGTAVQTPLSVEQAFVVSIDNGGDTPSGIVLSKSDVNENSAVNTVVGSITAFDEDVGETMTFTLSAPSSTFRLGNGGVGVCSKASSVQFVTANTACSVDLLVAGALDYETLAQVSAGKVLIGVTARDSLGANISAQFLIDVNNINEVGDVTTKMHR